MRTNNLLLPILGVFLLMDITPGFADLPTDVPKREKKKTLKDGEWIGC